VIVTVFDIGALHVKGREWKVGKGMSRGLLLKDGIGRGGKREGRRGRRKGGEQPALTIKKIVPAPLPVSINLCARLNVTNVMAPNGIRHRQTQSSRKFQSQDHSYQCQGQVAKANDILQGFCFQDQGNVS